MEYEKAYVFQPGDTRPAKRRRVELSGLQASWDRRRQAYKEAWETQRGHIDASLREINASTVHEIGTYLDEALTTQQDSRIPTAIILTGPSTASSALISEQLAESEAGHNGSRIFASISSNSGPNLKALLRTLIQRTTSRIVEDDDDLDDVPPSKRKGSKLLNYDLQLLANHVQEQQTQQVVLSFADTEAFDSNLLSELIQLLGCWRDRIPFVCLLNIATSVEFLQQRLSKAAIKCLQGKLFDVAPAGEALEHIFEAVTNRESVIWIGPDLAGMVLERQGDYIQSTDSFVDALQYSYMSHFYANALSIFLDPHLELGAVQDDHFAAARNLDSFRDWARDTLDSGKPAQVRRMLESNADFFTFVTKELAAGRRKLLNMVTTVDLIRLLQQHIPNTGISSKPKLYVQAMSGKLAGSAMLRTLLLTIRKQPSDAALNIAQAAGRSAGLDKATASDCKKIVLELEKMMQQQTSTSKPLRSEDDLKNATLRTTVVAQKVELSKQKAAISKEDSAYTALLRRFTDVLEAFFTSTLVDPKDLVFNEIFVYDLRSPYREVFTPRPRHAIERALAAPHDYLDCECCAPEKGTNVEATLAATQPATAVLYQLYLESTNLINVSDLWTAFQAVMGAEEDEQTKALFQRALADLKTLGMVKLTRKRVDHIAKVAWRGL
ncbi:origin recognition complex subunit 3-like [Teratosphaeria destructans]|uniref:Origin recognition complex subunit 3-like n=1 Tax=Teratosphaeria destructans TaxID=418781 RepID=A0A9W7SPN8_9PEZI|nr:origin recognition complex subunit 3-like [Teratosphaeria destructans]